MAKSRAIVMQKSLSAAQRSSLVGLLKARFEKNPHRHKDVRWEKLAEKLETHPDKLWSLQEVERTGGEPDVVGYEKRTGEYIFYDCSAESPAGRRNTCFDREALDARKENKPQDNAVDMAEAMGAALLTENEYRALQEVGVFDTKTSSWIQTPAEIRKLGGALFCDRRYDHVFTYHNGAQSYYSARGFRCRLCI